MFKSKIRDAGPSILAAARVGQTPDADDVAAYKASSGWGALSDQDKYLQRKVLAHRLKGTVPAATYATVKSKLALVLPVSNATVAAQKAKRQNAKMGEEMGKLRAELNALKSEVTKERHAWAAQKRINAAEMDAQKARAIAELTGVEAHIAEERKAGLAEVEAEKARAIAEVRALSAKLCEEPPEAVKVEVGGEIFTLDKNQVSQHQGILRAVFCDGFRARDLDEHGVYHLRVVSIAARDFHHVMKFYAGTMQPRFTPEDSEHLCYIARELGIDAMAQEIAKRTVDPTEVMAQRMETVLQRLEQAVARPKRWETALSSPYNERCPVPSGDGWQPFAALRFGEFCWRRPVPE